MPSSVIWILFLGPSFVVLPGAGPGFLSGNAREGMTGGTGALCKWSGARAKLGLASSADSWITSAVTLPQQSRRNQRLKPDFLACPPLHHSSLDTRVFFVFLSHLQRPENPDANTRGRLTPLLPRSRFVQCPPPALRPSLSLTHPLPHHRHLAVALPRHLPISNTLFSDRETENVSWILSLSNHRKLAGDL